MKIIINDNELAKENKKNDGALKIYKFCKIRFPMVDRFYLSKPEEKRFHFFQTKGYIQQTFPFLFNILLFISISYFKNFFFIYINFPINFSLVHFIKAVNKYRDNNINIEIIYYCFFSQFSTFIIFFILLNIF